MRRSCVVIGGGIAGMSAALLLARQGLDVTLVEKAPSLAPLVRGFRRKGIHFDTGFHHTGYLAQGEVLDRAFRLMGVSGLESFPLGENGNQRVVVEGGPATGYPFPSGFSRVQDILGDFFPRERSALRTYLNALQAAQDSSPYLAPGGADRNVAPYPDATLADVLDDLFTDVRLKSILASQALYHGIAPAETPFVFHAWVGAAAIRSLRGVKGGGEALTEAFESALGNIGVRVETGAGVSGITVTPAGTLSGVCLDDGRLLTADTCVSTIHPSLLVDLVPPGCFRPAYLHRLAGLAESPRAAMVFGMLPGNEVVAPGKSWLILNSHDPNQWFDGTIGENPGALSVMVSTSCEAGHSAGLELAVCGCRDGSKHEITNQITSYFNKMMPDFSREAVYLDSATPSTFSRFANSPFGSYYGPKHALGAHPPQPRTRLSGLYLAGQAVVAPGIAGAVISACVAVDTLLGADTTLKELRRC